MIHKCPHCGGEPEHDTTDRHGRWWDIHCCGAAFVDQSDWNCYATAMEYALAELWEDETDDVRESMDDLTEDCDAFEEIVDINLCAERAVFAARDAMRDAMREE